MIDGLVIREAHSDEAHVVHAVTRAAFAEHAREAHPSSALGETVDDVRRAMKDGGALLALVDGRAIGAARWAVDPAGPYLKYERLAVLPACRDHGIGRAIIAWLEQRAGEVGAREVRCDARSREPDNRPFYLALGYEVIGYSERYGVTDLRTHLVKRIPAR